MTGKEIASAIGIAPRTHMPAPEVLRRIRLESEFIADYAVVSGAYGIEWAIGTGRLSADSEASFMALSAYQICKYIAQMVEDGVTVMAHVPPYMNSGVS